jgi:hypothetical protein
MFNKKEEDSIPPISKGLIEKLNELFPERSAELEWSEKEVWFKTGQRNIIRFLNSHYDKQINSTMEKK